MRGGFIHNKVLLRPIVDFFRVLGAHVRVEHKVRLENGWGFVDGIFDYDGRRIVCEVELTPKRVTKDVEKAEALRADLLVIVTPDGRTAAKARRIVPASTVEVWILPLGKARQRLAEMFSISDAPNNRRSDSPEIE